MSKEEKLPTLSERIRPTRTNARESKEVNSKIFELVVNQMNMEKSKEGKENIRKNKSIRDRLRKKKKKIKKVIKKKKKKK